VSEHPSYVFCKLYRLVRANHQNDLIMFALAVNDDCRKSTKADQITERINLNTKAFFLLSTLFSGGDRTVEHIAESSYHQTDDSAESVFLKGINDSDKTGQHSYICQNNGVVVISQ